MCIRHDEELYQRLSPRMVGNLAIGYKYVKVGSSGVLTYIMNEPIIPDKPVISTDNHFCFVLHDPAPFFNAYEYSLQCLYRPESIAAVNRIPVPFTLNCVQLAVGAYIVPEEWWRYSPERSHHLKVNDYILGMLEQTNKISPERLQKLDKLLPIVWPFSTKCPSCKLKPNESKYGLLVCR